MTRAHPLLTQQKIEAFTAAMLWALAWLVDVMTKLGAPKRSRMLLRAVRYCEDRVECVLFLHAARLCRLRPRRAHYSRPSPGFRQARPCARLLLRSARLRAQRGASFHDRVARLVEVMAQPEPFIARFCARIRKGLCGLRQILAAPIADAIASAPSATPSFANSS